MLNSAFSLVGFVPTPGLVMGSRSSLTARIQQNQHHPNVDYQLPPTEGAGQGAYSPVGGSHCNQALGSIPRDLSSFRMTLLSQAEIDSSPSISIACFIALSKPGSTLKAICLLPLGNFVFDMCLTQWLSCLCLTMYNTFKTFVKQRNPVVLATHTGFLTTNDIESIEAAMQNHTTPLTGRNSLTPNKFIWRFLAINRAERQAKPCRLSIEATSEQEARKILAPHFILSFAGRLPIPEVSHV